MSVHACAARHSAICLARAVGMTARERRTVTCDSFRCDMTLRVAPDVRDQPRQVVEALALSFSARLVASRGSRQQQGPVKRINDTSKESSARTAGELVALKSFAIEMRRTGSAKHESRSAFRTLGLANARRHFVCFGHHANGPFEARIPTPPHLLELAERRPAASRVHQKKAYQRYLAPVRY